MFFVNFDGFTSINSYVNSSHFHSPQSALCCANCTRLITICDPVSSPICSSHHAHRRMQTTDMNDKPNKASPAPPPHHASTAYSAEVFYKKQLDVANEEKAQLQRRLRHVEDQNKSLLKSLFELSCSPPATSVSSHLPIDVVSALRKLSDTAPFAAVSGKGSAYRRSGATDAHAAPFATNPGLRPHISPDYTPFRSRIDLKGHSSAVYAVQFSPNGRLLVSVSFDRSVRFWPINRFVDKNAYDPNLSIVDAHRAPVVAVEWAFDSRRVITGALDQSAAEWDVERGDSNQALSRFSCHGLVNCVSVSPANENIVLVATSRRVIHLFDRRLPNGIRAAADTMSSIILSNDSAVNTVHITLDGQRVITGDHFGAIKTWDLRFPVDAASPVDASHVGSKYNDPNRRPITHIHTSPPLHGEEYGRYMAVNSYDSYLRVYDRGTFFLQHDEPDLAPVHALRGVVNANWPIKSSFFLGADYSPPKRGHRRPTARKNRDRPADPKPDQPPAGDDDAAAYSSASDDDDDKHGHSSDSSSEDGRPGDSDNANPSRGHEKDVDRVVGGPIRSALILASGSADGMVYIFDVGARSGRGALLQTLEGHKDRVYATDFHPNEPILATCSADSDIKIWHTR